MNRKLNFNLFAVVVTLCFSLYFLGCNKPFPVELFDDLNISDPVQAEVISPDPEDDYTANGYDSTGYVLETPKYGVVFHLAKNIITDYTIGATPVTRENNFGQGLFFDKQSPVFSTDGKLIGYKTVPVEYVRMRGIFAPRTDFSIKFKMPSGFIKDSVLGPRYFLFKPKGIIGNLFDFDYNSPVDIEIKVPVLQKINISVLTPFEIRGGLKIINTAGGKRFVLEWIKYQGKVTIIVGGRKRGKIEVVPLYRISTDDDGSFQIPGTFIESIPKNKFDAVVFSIQRKKEYYREELNSQVYIGVQNSYNVVAPL